MIEEYIQNQLEEDLASDQITLKEYIDPFTGSKRKQAKRKQPLLAAACDSDAMTNPQYPFQGSAKPMPTTLPPDRERNASALTGSLPMTAWRWICKRYRMNSTHTREMCGQLSCHFVVRTPSDSDMITAADGEICSGRKRKRFPKICGYR